MEKKEKQKRGVSLLILLLFLLVFFLPAAINSGLVRDDRYNFNARGAKFFEEYSSTLSFSLSVNSGWIKQGRIFPLAFYAYCFFDVIQSVGAPDPIALYKTVIVASIMINCILIYSVLEKLLGHGVSFVCVLFFPIFCNMSLSHCNAVYSFHMLVQSVFSLSLISLLFLERSCECMRKEDKNSKRAIIINTVLSCVFLFLSLMMYELSYVFIVFHVLIVFSYFNDIKTTLKRSAPSCCLWFVCLAVNMTARFLTPPEVKYNNFDNNIRKIFIIFIKQLTGSFPIITYKKDKELFSLPADPKSFIGSLGLINVAVMVLFCGIFGFAAYKIYKKEITVSSKVLITALIGGALLAAMPAGLISLSAEVQPRISVGRGYLPEYMSSFGVAICFAVLIIKLLSLVFERKKAAGAVLSCFFAITGSVLLTLSLFEAKATTECYPNIIDTYRINIVANAAKFGLFDNVTDGDLVVGCTDACFDANDPPLFYSSICNRKIQAVSVNNFEEGKYGVSTVITLKSIQFTGKAYAAFHITDEKGSGIVMLGEFLSRDDGAITFQGPVMCYISNKKTSGDLSRYVTVNNFDGTVQCLKQQGDQGIYIFEQNDRPLSTKDIIFSGDLKSSSS